MVFQQYGVINMQDLDFGAIATIISAVFTLVGVIVTIVIGVNNIKKEIYSKNVIDERAKWLTSFRDDLGTFMAAWEMKKNSNNNSNTLNFDKHLYDEMMIEGEKSRYILISKLNTSTLLGNEYNKYLKDHLEKMSLIGGLSINNMNSINEKEFMIFMNLMLENEWQKIKKEAK